MADVKEYNRGQAPSLAVGTAGANYAPGEAYRTLAEGIGKVREQFAQTRMSKLNAILEPLRQQAPYLGQAIGRDLSNVLAQNVEHKAKLQRSIQHNAVADSLFNFQSDADASRAHGQQNYTSHPEVAEDDYNGTVGAAVDKYQQDLETRFPNSPEVAQTFREKAREYQRSQAQTVNQWALTQGKDNASANVKTSGDQTVADVSQAQGTPEQKLQAYSDAKARFTTLTANNVPVLGKSQMQDAEQKNTFKLGVAFYQNMIADTPIAPQAAIDHLHDVGQMLDKLQIPLPPEEKTSLRGTISAQMERATKLLVNQSDVDVLDHDVAIRKVNNALLADPYNSAKLNSAKNFAATQVASIQQQVMQVKTNPAMSAESKDAALKGLEKQLGHLDTISHTVDSQQSHIATKQEENARHADSEARANAREARTAAREAKRDQSQAALRTIVGHIAKARTMNPETDMKAIQEEYHQAALATNGALDNGLITADKWLTLQDKNVGGVKAAAKGQSAAPDPFQQFVKAVYPAYNIPIKQIPKNQRQQATSDAAKTVMSNADDILNMHQWDEANHRDGFSSTMSAEFDKRAAFVTQRAEKEKWQPIQVTNRLAAIRTDIMSRSAQ